MNQALDFIKDVGVAFWDWLTEADPKDDLGPRARGWGDNGER